MLINNSVWGQQFTLKLFFQLFLSSSSNSLFYFTLYLPFCECNFASNSHAESSGELLETQIVGLYPQSFRFSKFGLLTQKLAFLTCSKLLLMWLIMVSHFENHYTTIYITLKILSLAFLNLHKLISFIILYFLFEYDI